VQSWQAICMSNGMAIRGTPAKNQSLIQEA
jgi:hypothetical protein